MPALYNWSVSKLGLSSTKPSYFNRTAACIHHCPLRHPAPSLEHWSTGVYLWIFDPGPSNPTTFLGLCSPGDYRQSIESPMGDPIFNSTERRLNSLFMIVLWDYGQKGLIFDEIYPFGCEVHLPSDICWMLWADKSAYAAKGLRVLACLEVDARQLT